MAKSLAAVALDVGCATSGSVSLCCNTRRRMEFVLSCPFDVEGAVLCTHRWREVWPHVSSRRVPEAAVA
jgi:hypothetical protein